MAAVSVSYFVFTDKLYYNEQIWDVATVHPCLYIVQY